MAYPSEANYCFRADAVVIHPTYQQQTCLTTLHGQCARFRDPASVVDGMPPAPTAVARVQRMVLVVIICGLFVTGILQLWPVLSDMWLNGDVQAQVERPSAPVATDAAAVAQPATPEMTLTAVVNAASLNVRSRPQPDAEVTAVLPPNATIQLTGRTADGAWGRLRQDDGTAGWILLPFVTPSQPLMTLPVVD